MKVILLNTPLFKEPGESNDEDSLPPYGLGYIATYLQMNNIEVEIIDAIAEKLSVESLISQIEVKKPDFLGLNVFTTNYEIVKDLVTCIKIKTHIIVGSLATKTLYKKILNWETNNQIDIVIGDGELIMPDLVKGIEKDKCFYQSGKRRVFKIDKLSEYHADKISNIPLNRDFFLNEPKINIYNQPEVNLVTSRGCIYNCSFCAAARSHNKEFGVRERGVLSIIAELREIILKYPLVKSIRILDDLFLKSNESIKKAYEIFSKFDLGWRSMAHVRTFSKIKQEYLSSMKKSGCKELFIGIESGSPKILKNIHKTDNVVLIKKNLSKLFKAGIDIKGYFIFGFPEETEQDAQMTYNLAMELKDDSIKYGANFRTSVFQFRPYHGTEIYEKLKNKYPDFHKETISQNNKLSQLIGREQFNFHSNNYSNISLDNIHDYICKTNMIQWNRPRH